MAMKKATDRARWWPFYDRLMPLCSGSVPRRNRTYNLVIKSLDSLQASFHNIIAGQHFGGSSSACTGPLYGRITVQPEPQTGPSSHLSRRPATLFPSNRPGRPP
jgi:hypothetical protein